MIRDKKKKKIPNSYKMTFPFLLLIATFFMGIGYASINSITADISGIAVANKQDGIFITDVDYDSDNEANLDRTKIISKYQTTLNSRVVLSDTNNNSSITYKITVYNSTDDDYIFTEVKYILGNDTYDNENISFKLINLDEKTLLPAKDSVTFYVKFYYSNNEVADNNVLNSFLNFSFKKFYSISYINIDNNNLPSYVIDKSNLILDFSNNDYDRMNVKINGSEIDNFTYENKILTINEVYGNVIIEAISDKYLVTFDSNIPVGKYTGTDGFVVEEKTEAAGDYYRASFSESGVTSDLWYRIEFPTYDYKVGSTYKIRIKTRMKEIVNLNSVELRNAAIKNDWGTEGNVNIKFHTDEIDVWNEYELTRTFDSSTVVQSGQNYSVSPRLEIYTSNLNLYTGTSNISLTFDYKDVYVGEITTKQVKFGNQIGELPTATREGYIFGGWYTEPEGGKKISSTTIATNSDMTYYAHWINPDDPIIPEEPIIPEDPSKKVIVTYDTNMNVSNYVSTDGFTIEERNDDGGKYYRASFSKTSGTSDVWNSIEFPTYDYKVGSTYKIKIKTRLQKIVNVDNLQLRHSAIENDWGTEGRLYDKINDDEIGEWNEYELTRTFDSATVTQNGTSYSLSPRIEIYTGNLALVKKVRERSVILDYKDVYVSEIITSEVNYGGKLGVLPTPVRDNYTFKGWYTEPEGGTKVSSSTVVTSDTAVTYYAQWTSN